VPGTDDLQSADGFSEIGETGINWVVFLVRASAIVVLGAMLITSFDLSQSRGAEWPEIMRVAILRPSAEFCFLPCRN
jgi:hypothetical protein